MKRLIILATVVLLATACGDGGTSPTPAPTDAPNITNPLAIRSELPEDFPIPVPDGADVQTAAGQETPDGMSFGALIRFEDGRYEELVEYYDEFAADLPGIERLETSTERDGVTWRNMETGLLITVSQIVGAVSLAITVPPGALSP